MPVFQDVGLGPGVKPGSGAPGSMLPEQMERGVGAVYDRARLAGATHEQAEEAVRISVYGVGYKTDKRGRPIEDAVGSWPHKVTLNSLAAIRKYEGEVAYTKMLRKLWADSPDRARQIGAPEPPRASA